MPSTPRLLWKPSNEFINNSNLKKYVNWLRHERGLSFADYNELWQWSVDNIDTFWESIWDYFDVISHFPYKNVLENRSMPGTKWFSGAKLNYAEHIFRNKSEAYPAIICKNERDAISEISWAELEQRVASLSHQFNEWGLTAGDRVAAFLPNIPEASISFLAACANGLTWSSCSPDFGLESVVDRFQLIEPKVLIACDGYTYNGKPYNKLDIVDSIMDQIPSIEQVIIVPYLNHQLEKVEGYLWNGVTDHEAELTFIALPFDHPIWVLYSSGTTGKPKAITHSHGGVLLEHLKYLSLHNDVKPGERFFWYSTTGWMMWNFVHASMLVGATIVLYEGGAAYPNMTAMWQFASDVGINHFGTSAPFIVACMKRGVKPAQNFDLSALRSIGSTGAPLPPEGFDYVYNEVKRDLWLCSMSGGTDVCTAFVGGNPFEPVYEGEIQCRTLGCDLHAYNEEGGPVLNQVGEMVIKQPMPSMPIYFWNDEGMERYKDSYFNMFDGIWRHGDWVEVTDRGSLIIYGRSDATLNRQGVRIGTAEIYQVLNGIDGLKDSLIMNFELKGGKHFMPLFVVLQDGFELDSALKNEITAELKRQCSPRHVPDEIIMAPDVPYTISGKKMEAPVKNLILGLKEPNLGAMRNPESMEFYRLFSDKVKAL